MKVADVDAELAVEPIHVLRHRLPAEIDGAQHLHRDRFDIGQEFRQPLRLARAHRRKRQRAIAEDHRGGAVIAGIGAQRIPGDLRVVVAVVVDETRRHDGALRIDDARRGAAQLADLGDLAVLHRDIAAECRHARAIDDAAIADQQIIGHRLVSSLGCPERQLWLWGKCSAGGGERIPCGRNAQETVRCALACSIRSRFPNPGPRPVNRTYPRGAGANSIRRGTGL